MLEHGDYTLKINGLNLWYKVAGSGPVCIMVTPGWGCSSELYFLTMQGFESMYTMVYLDTRGSGRSEGPSFPEDYTYENFASDLDGLRQHLKLDKLLIMGHSQGTAHALKYALMYPDHCAGLILIEGMTDMDEFFSSDINNHVMLRKDEPWFEEAFAVLSSDEPIETEAAFLQHLLGIMPFYVTDQSILEKYQSVFEAMTVTLAPMAGQGAVQRPHRMLNDIHQIDAPVLLLVGSDDFICSPLQSERIHLRVHNSKLIVYEHVGHFPWMETPDVFYSRARAGLEALNLI